MSQSFYQYSFEKLKVWERSKELVKMIYKAVKTIPDEEKFGMISQMKRASISISSNLAEGSARKTSKDQAYFTTISYGSLMELLNLTIVAFELEYISEKTYLDIRAQIQEISAMLNSLRSAQLNP
ncbi:MAG: four helix bundle protein [Saprospiraceae bacterium]|nr:four helix bundle protein [Saprospiraceae bacterium]